MEGFAVKRGKTALFGLVFMAGMTAVPANASSINLINNGSFEQGNLGNNPFQIFQDIPGWMTTADYVEIQNTQRVYGIAAPDGYKAAEIDFNGNGITQRIDTEHRRYLLSFDYATRPGYGNQRLDIRWDNQRIARVGGVDNRPVTADPYFQSYSFYVNGRASTSLLGLISIANLQRPGDAGGNLIDNVRLFARPRPGGGAPVPEPASACLLGMGLIGWRLKRRTQALR